MEDILSLYDKPYRFYHNKKHIISMISNLEKYFKIDIESDYEMLTTAIYFHDVVYNIHRNDNEEKSFEFFKNSKYSKFFNTLQLRIIKGLIMVTKTLEPTNELEKIMIFLDWSIFLQDEKGLSDYNYQIFKEYQEYNTEIFFTEREKFFKKAPSMIKDALSGSISVKENLLEKLLTGIEKAHILFKGFSPKIGVYVGSFNPFHTGHIHILEKAEKVFDKVIVVQAVNPEKIDSIEYLPKIRRELVRIEDLVFIGSILNDLNSKFNHSMTLVRGIRTGTDLIAEQAYQQTIKELGCTYPILHLLCDPEFQHISSTMVRNALKLSVKTDQWIVYSI